MITGRGRAGGATDGEFGIDIYTLLHLKWTTNKDLLYSSGDPAQCHVAAWMGGEFGGEWPHVICMAESLCCPPETITTLSANRLPQYKLKS